MLQALAPEAYAKPYFTALFDHTVSRQEVMDLMRLRPEVAEVQPLETREVSGPLGKLLEKIGADYQVSTEGLASFGLRVVLNGASMLAKGQALRSTLEVGHGATHVTISDVRLPKVTGLFSTHPFFRYLARFGFAGLLIPLFTLWVIAFALCSGHFTRRAWLVERYQRRRWVKAKTMASGLALIVGSTVVLGIIIQGPDVIGMALLLSVFSIPWATTLRETRWLPQN